MRLVVAYDSTYGNTRRVAEAIAESWPSERPDPPVPLRDLDARRLDRETLLVVGAPTHGHGVDEDTWRAFERIPHERFRERLVAAFDTRFDMGRWITGSAARSLEKALVARGAIPIAPAESFFVAGREGPLEAGELERAREWGRRLHTLAVEHAVPRVVAMPRA